MKKTFEEAFEYKIIYIFAINDDLHKKVLKIGDTTLKTKKKYEDLKNNSKELNDAAKARIKSYTTTIGVSFEILHTEIAILKDKNENLKAFRDYNVHQVLKNSNIKNKNIGNSKEWFEVDLETAKKAIKAVKNNKNSLDIKDISENKTPIIFRPEQKKAIQLTKEVFKKNNDMLWNAKMRFGKTLCALQVIKECNFEKTLIITHRPVVDRGWYEDFIKIFYDREDFIYGSKNNGYNIDTISKNNKNFIYFASIQDLRGSTRVGGNLEKNDELFDMDWDLIIVDEAHEGTTTTLGVDVIKELIKENTKTLSLSGTPFNILSKFEDNIYTWDYIMEQESKAKWDEQYFGDSNPYDELPEMKIYTYDLGELLNKKNYNELEDKAFNFKEFFKVWTGNENIDGRKMQQKDLINKFIHEDDIKSFLNLITKNDNNSQYPYSSEEYRNLFKHVLWMVPGVKEAKALSELLREHPIFGSGIFKIVNIAGDGDSNDEEESKDAFLKVRSAINNSEGQYTITLSCGKLTTGVTIPEWTAVFMLSGSYSTSAANYLQTIFRVQSPCNIDGKIKKYCYVFDFAPDRTLKMVAESVALSTKAGKTTENDKQIMSKFLNYCPVISIDGTRMEKYDTSKLLKQLKRAYAEKVFFNGFDDKNLYNDELLKLTELEIEKFNNLKNIAKEVKNSTRWKDISINNQGFNENEYEEIEQIQKKVKKDRTPEEEEKLKEALNKKKMKEAAISILKAISIRLPLLIYGIDVDINKSFKIEKLVDLVDEDSWKEFMPEGVTKDLFKSFIKYYDQEVFEVASQKIRNMVLEADLLSPEERVKKIGTLFSYFKNPDKETVLTPWKVVNIHMSDCLGGYSFFDNLTLLEEPIYKEHGNITKDIFENNNAKILEINSKTGLYPLYIAYSIFKNKCKEYDEKNLTLKLKNDIWSTVIKNNIYVICKTNMAKLITTRTLIGFKNNVKINAHSFDNLINILKNKNNQFKERILKESYWKKEGKGNMKFDAIVGNPPYQENISNSDGNTSLSKQLFPLFIEKSIALNARYVSLITPSRWFTGDAQDKSFINLRLTIQKNNHLKKIFNYPDNKILFSNVEIAGGVNYFLYDSEYKGDVEFTECSSNKRTTIKRPLFEDGLDIIIAVNELISILHKVEKNKNFKSLMAITYGRNAFGIVGKKSILEKISEENRFYKAIELYCAKEEKRYTKEENIIKNIDVVKKWKVFISKGNGGAGIINPDKPVAILGKAYVGAPNTACTDSLIPIGPFDTQQEAINLQKYLQTKFLRLMVGILKTSQNLYQNVYKFVPIQDFTNESDIDWSQDIDNIDLQLFKKYNLSAEEVIYVNEKIKKI